MMEFKRTHNAALLPLEWDELTDSYFQTKSFLSHTEKFNPCGQRYYLCFADGILVSAAITYSLRLDILTFFKLKSPVRVHIIGVPCSVSSAGIFGTAPGTSKLKEHIFENEKGFVLALNLSEIPNGKYASARTLPTVVLRNLFLSWDEYVSSLRSPYRRRLKIIDRTIDELKIEIMPCSGFTIQMYNQYLEVYERSSGKLEKLSSDFFKFLPENFRLTVCYHGNSVIGWNIGIHHRDTWYFFLGGYDYQFIREHKTYFILLTEIVKQGIAQKAGIIEMGQTAEIPKVRMGGELKPLYMEAHHSNAIADKILRAGGNLLGYKRKTKAVHTFRKEYT
jgi:hypothetical protein